MVVFGLLAFGGLILGGLYLSPRAYPPQPPANVALAAPQRKLRFLSYDLHRQHPGNDPLFSGVVAMDPKPDYVFLQGVNEDDSVEIAQLLGMEQSFHPQLYQRSEHLATRLGTWGNLILSLQSLYLGSPLGGKRGGFGVSAMSVVDERAFYVACTHLASGDAGVAETADLERIWKSLGSPPMVVAVLPSDPKPPAGLDFLPTAVDLGGEWFYLTKDWVIVATDTSASSAGGLTPRWIDVTRAPVVASQPQ